MDRYWLVSADEADLLKSVASLHQTDRPNLNRKLSSSLDTKKGKKGRLSVIEAPADHGGLSNAVTQPITPVELTPEASSSRLPSTPVPQPSTPMSVCSPQLDKELENLRQQNEVMKKKLEELKSQNSTVSLRFPFFFNYWDLWTFLSACFAVPTGCFRAAWATVRKQSNGGSQTAPAHSTANTVNVRPKLQFC